VFKFYHQKGEEKKLYACKKTALAYVTDCPPQKQKSRWNSMIRELVILELIDSPYVVKVYEFLRTSGSFYMIQEYANGGSLQDLLDLRGKFPESVAKKLLRQIIGGLSALYEMKVVHRDLKLDNILISFPNLGENLTKEQKKSIDMEKEEFCIKIADLGYSRALEVGEKAKTGCGTPL